MALNVERHGPYALVTGASAGIGEQFARQLAQQGFDLVLVARRKDRLEALAAQLRARHGVQVRVLDIDLARPDAAEQLFRATVDVHVGLLVLNAGVYGFGGFFENGLPYDENLLQLNVTVPLKMAHLFGSKMVEAGRGAMILVASTAGFGAMPYNATYAASKAYLLALGEALNYELAPQGIDVLVLAPGMTKTEGQQAMRGVGANGINVPLSSSEDVVRAALANIGRSALVVPGWLNRFMIGATKYLLSRRAQTALYGKAIAKAMR
nr:SDR family NAD(P)-dependent oxidoreductase [uncultured Massilia sp.]